MSEVEQRAARERVLRHIQSWRPEDLAATAGALSVMPENAHHAATLETLSLIATTTAATGTKRPSRDDVKQLLSLMRAWTAWGDDHFGSTHTAATTFFGGSFTFFPSDAPTICALKCAYSALSRLATDRATSNVIKTLWAIASLANEVARRCDYARYKKVSQPSHAVQLPIDSRLRQLRAAVTFESSELEVLLGADGREAIEAVTCEPIAASIPLAPFMEDDQPIETRPIVRVGSKYIVIAPRLLDRASLHFLWRAAREQGWLSNFNVALHTATAEYIDRLFGLFGASSAHPSPTITFLQGAIASQFGYRVDVDKVIAVTLVTENPCAEVPVEANWKAPGVSEFLRDSPKCRQRPILDGHLGHVLDLDLVLPTVHYGNISFDAPKRRRPPLVLKVDELESIVLVEAPQTSALVLWKFADHLEEVQQTTEFVRSEMIDLYSLWRRDGRDLLTRLGLNRDQLPNAVFVAPGMGREMREMAAKNADVHGEETPDRRGRIEVICAEAESALIYVPLYVPHGHALMEAGRLRVWLTAEVEGAHARLVMLGRSLGYWCRYFRNADEEFRRLTDAPTTAVLKVRTSPTTFIRIEPNSKQGPDASTFEVHSDGTDVRLEVHDAFWMQMTEENNQLEVRLACAVIQEMLATFGNKPTSDLIARLQSLALNDPNRRMWA